VAVAALTSYIYMQHLCILIVVTLFREFEVIYGVAINFLSLRT